VRGKGRPPGYIDLMADLDCDCGQRLMWLVCESRASPTLARQLWRCTSCEQFTWYLERPPWPDGLLDGMLSVAPFREFLSEQEAEIARDAYGA
jgi:hypothetical protein